MPLIRRGLQLVRFQLEQFIVRGTLSRLIVIALTMIIIAVAAGLVAYSVLPRADYADHSAAIWWAFLRLTDSGYLGDDQGIWLRAISTTLTVLGVVLFVGALIATMTQWLNDTIETLEAGYTPIAKNDHILVLGWNNRTAEIIDQLVAAEGRVKRFLRSRGAKRLAIVVLAERVSPALTAELRDVLGRSYKRRQIILRSGNPLRADHLKRVDYAHAGAIVLAAPEFVASGTPDERTIKTLMSAATAHAGLDPEALPLMVAEIYDADLLATARSIYPGPSEIVGTAEIIAHVLVNAVRTPWLIRICNELLAGHDDPEANRFYVRIVDDELVGRRLTLLADDYEHAVLIGLARDGGFLPVHGDDDVRVAAGDRLAFIARSYDDCLPVEGRAAASTPRAARVPRRMRERPVRRVLILGWNQKLPSMLAAFAAHHHEEARIDICSALSIAEREAMLARQGISVSHMALRQIEMDTTAYAQLSGLDLTDYDVVVLVASDWLGSAEAADARLLLCHLVLRRALAAADADPRLVVETMAEENASLFAESGIECLVSPVIQSNLLSQIALRRELHWVVAHLFGARGAEIALRNAVPTGERHHRESVAALAAGAAAKGEVLLGILHGRHGPQRIELNPRDRDTEREFGPDDRLIVLESEVAESAADSPADNTEDTDQGPLTRSV
ncbi:hypothetical protein [Salinisphaera sp. Q1T1-3]|uniref:hypothetical protein n=1 Tax=Salinisphaera sp. Q1T1-3 TaxID=2321229 RepID=UPI000E75D4D8|nr:hypothetical protein [Salinisphaera sp. Q1T1-3]RJS94325.1 hypothetical protein D3260_04245 [Salinisphaera sp. Q1T1-3]